MIHNISYRAFVYGTESKEKVLEAISTLFPNSSPQCEATEGYYKNQVLILHDKIDKKKSIKEFVELLSSMDDPAKKRIINQLEDKMDDYGNLFLRFDKQRAYQGDLKVVEHGDSIHTKIKIAAYPAKKRWHWKLEGNYSTKKNYRENFYDLNISGNKGIVQEAERLGFAGVSLTYNFDDYNSEISKEYDELKHESNILMRNCLEINCKNPEELKKKVRKSRKIADIVLVRGGDNRINRAACEDRNVDILSQPYRNRRDSGMNHVLARKAAENDVAVEINLSSFLKTNLRYRHRIVSQFRHIMALKRKYGFSVIITSGARSSYDQRNPLDIFALSNCFGMTENESFEALSIIPQHIIDRNDNRDNFVLDGVRTVVEL